MAKKKTEQDPTTTETNALVDIVIRNPIGHLQEDGTIVRHELPVPVVHLSPDDQVLDWPDPTPEMLDTPEFNAVWACIKQWDINVPGAYNGYMGATGNHARAILDALSSVPRPDLRAVRTVIDTLVFGCESQRARQDAAAPAIEVLDRLIGE
jgi:hypothetical protein